MPLEPPDDVARWAAERAAARTARDFVRADELRRLIAGAGWEVVDRPEGFELHRATPATAPPVISVVAELDAWPDDAARFLASLQRHRPEGVEVVAADAGAGFAAARNAAFRRAAGTVVVVVDTSLELTGDLFGPLLAALDDPGVAVAGPFGLRSADLRDYQERTEGEVAAVQGYCLAARRSDVAAAGGFRESFAFYRNADIELSLRLRTLGGDVRRAVAVGADRCRRHPHRAWEATAPDDRDRLSRRNMRRILDRFGDRKDLVVP
jgi:Glycosyl transferase family 2